MRVNGRTPTFLPWLVWGVAELLYIVAVMNRTSLAALGPATQEHFNIQATALSSFAVLQLVMYAGMQIPVGILIDKYGPTIVMIAGGTVMFAGQFVMAFTGEVWVAVVARMFLGAGDACIFISVMRIIPEWFAPRTLPFMGQFTGILGNLGQVLSVLPLAFGVTAFGWSAAFTGVAAAGMLVTILGTVVLRDKPGSKTLLERIRGKRGHLSERAEILLEGGEIGLSALPSTTEAIGTITADEKQSVFKNLATLIRIPGIRLGFWMHFAPPFAATALLLLWGTPFLVGAVGITLPQASLILTSMAPVSVVAGIILGRLTSRHADKRVYVVIGIVIAIMLSWIPVVLWPGRPPLWLVLISLTIVFVGGPASMVAFEVVRSYSPRRMIGIATGMANMGGFISALAAIFAIGLLLDMQNAGTPETYRPDAFSWATATMFVIWGIGLAGLLIELHKTKKWNAQRPN